MERLNNIYYAQYANKQYANEPVYDSDNKRIDNCDESKYMQLRNKKETLYEDWLIQRYDLEKIYQKRVKDILIQSGKNFVKYICKYKGNSEILGTDIFKFKITIVYCSFRCKWYISPGYSFVPEVIDLNDKLKSGTYHPISEKILDIIYEIQRSIDAYMNRFAIVHQFMYNARRIYKDMQFFINSNAISEIELIFTENAWPSGLRKLNIRDTIVVKLTLNEDIQVCNITYEYIRTSITSKDIKEDNDKLKLKLKNFYNFPLEMAFKRFMEEENFHIEQENLKARM
ncbi:uncharacterized protein LOC126858623 [Cataglyphis hispanica]|uniref:uncharacterized protein LOC126858623 n=1 Tax=Cataglyphis hispanica TaxID=1086592 RepID=UPI00217F25C5|nr:uncharacterized protein LOC126858623 [Cataglyphis hispanica]